MPNNVDMGHSSLNGIGIYKVVTNTWTWEAVPPNVAGSVWGFDEATGSLIGIGKQASLTAYYLYGRCRARRHHRLHRHPHRPQDRVTGAISMA